MIQFTKKMQRFLTSEDGPTAVEYAVMLALIIIVCLVAIQSLGTNASDLYEYCQLNRQLTTTSLASRWSRRSIAPSR